MAASKEIPSGAFEKQKRGKDSSSIRRLNKIPPFLSLMDGFHPPTRLTEIFITRLMLISACPASGESLRPWGIPRTRVRLFHLFHLRERSLKSFVLLHLIYRVPPFPIVDYDNSPNNGRNIQLSDTVSIDVEWICEYRGRRYRVKNSVWQTIFTKKVTIFGYFSDPVISNK